MTKENIFRPDKTEEEKADVLSYKEIKVVLRSTSRSTTK